MALSSSLVEEFAKITHDSQENKELTTFYGTAKFEKDGDYVLIDGATAPTPATYATSAVTGDRVMGTIKNRRAVITTNITNPSMTLGILRAINGIIVNGYLTTNENRIVYNDKTHTGLTYSNGGMGAYGGLGKYWCVTNTGELEAQSADIAGRIVAREGYIGSESSGFKIDQYGIYSGESKSGTTAGFITLSNIDFPRAIGARNATMLRFAIGSNFGVDATGNMFASNIDVEGTIKATGGTIASYKIAGSALYSNTKDSFSSTAAGVYLGSDGIAIGQNTPFKVTSEGKLYATGAEITGKLEAGANSKIGPWSVSDTAIYKTNSNFNNASSLYFGDSGLSIKQNFVVDNTGSLTAKVGSIGNWTIGNSTNQANGSLYSYGTGGIGTANSVYLIPGGQTGSVTIGGRLGSDWVVTAGTGFGVTKSGALYVTSGNVGTLHFDSSAIYTNTYNADSTGSGVRISYGSVPSGGSSSYYVGIRQGSSASWLTADTLSVNSGQYSFSWNADGPGILSTTGEFWANYITALNPIAIHASGSNEIHIGVDTIMRNNTTVLDYSSGGLACHSIRIFGHTTAIGDRITATNQSAVRVGEPDESISGDEGIRTVVSLWMPIGMWVVTCSVTIPKGSDETYAELNFRNSPEADARDAEYIVGKVGTMRVQLVKIMNITTAGEHYFNVKTGSPRTISAGGADVHAVRIA